MGEHKHYKESGKFSPVGAVLMVLATAVCGGLLFWLYLLFEGWCTIIYLNVIAAIAVSCALGFVGGKIVRAFKMRNTVVAVACAVVGFLFASYFKWALYDYNDLKKYGYELMGEYTAYDYYDELNMLFDENTDGFGDYYDFSATIQQAISQTRTLPRCRKSLYGSFSSLTSFLARIKNPHRKALKSHTP